MNNLSLIPCLFLCAVKACWVERSKLDENSIWRSMKKMREDNLGWIFAKSWFYLQQNPLNLKKLPWKLLCGVEIKPLNNWLKLNEVKSDTKLFTRKRKFELLKLEATLKYQNSSKYLLFNNLSLYFLFLIFEKPFLAYCSFIHIRVIDL